MADLPTHGRDGSVREVEDAVTVYHAIERTSPKGPGAKFLGVCRLCGAPNLPANAALQACPNPRGLTTDESLIEAIEYQLPALVGGRLG